MVAKDHVANIKVYGQTKDHDAMEGLKNHTVSRLFSIGLLYLPNIHNNKQKNFE